MEGIPASLTRQSGWLPSDERHEILMSLPPVMHYPCVCVFFEHQDPIDCEMLGSSELMEYAFMITLVRGVFLDT